MAKATLIKWTISYLYPVKKPVPKIDKRIVEIFNNKDSLRLCQAHWVPQRAKQLATMTVFTEEFRREFKHGFPGRRVFVYVTRLTVDDQIEKLVKQFPIVEAKHRISLLKIKF